MTEATATAPAATEEKEAVRFLDMKEEQEQENNVRRGAIMEGTNVYSNDTSSTANDG